MIASSGSETKNLLSINPTNALSATKEDVSAEIGAESGDHEVPIGEKQHWVFSSFMTVGYILGTGVLVLPSSMAALGFLLGTAVCVFFALLSTYIAILLGRLKNDHYPECLSYKELAKMSVGKKFENALEFLTCINWFMTMALYILTAVESFTAAFNSNLCGYDWGLICVVVLLPSTLITDMKGMENMAAMSDLAAIVIVAVVLALLASQGGNSPSEHKHNFFPPKESFLDAFNPISSFIFAYQGQSIFLEVISEMRYPREWNKSVYLSHSLMFISYSITAIVGYYYMGNDVPAFLPKGLKKGIWKTLVNLLVAYHVLVAYIINNIPLVAMLKRRYFEGSRTPRSKHVMISALLLFLAWLMTNIVPFFKDMVSVIGALCGSPIMLGLPPLFYFCALKSKGIPMGRFDLVVCSLLFFVLFPLTFVSGMISAFRSILGNWERNGLPFSCSIQV